MGNATDNLNDDADFLLAWNFANGELPEYEQRNFEARLESEPALAEHLIAAVQISGAAETLQSARQPLKQPVLAKGRARKESRSFSRAFAVSLVSLFCLGLFLMPAHKQSERAEITANQDLNSDAGPLYGELMSIYASHPLVAVDADFDAAAEVEFATSPADIVVPDWLFAALELDQSTQIEDPPQHDELELF